MYKSLANAVMIESAKANTAYEAAKARLVEDLQGEPGVLIGRMEDVARTQATLAIWTKLYTIAERYNSDAALQSKRLVFATNKLRDELVEDYGVLSTNAWLTAQDATVRRAKVEAYAILREFTD
jgi:hypothetical protein